MGIFLVILATFFLSIKGIFTKLAYLNGATVDATLFYRYLFSIPLVFLVLGFRRKFSLIGLCTKREWGVILILSFTGYYVAAKFDYIAITKIDVGISRIILFTYPIFVLGFNAFLNKRIPVRHELIAIIFIEFGIFLILGGLNLTLLKFNIVGALFSLGSACTYGAYIVLIERKGMRFDSQFLITWVVTFACCYITIDFMLTNDTTELMLTSRAFLWVFMMAVFSTALPLTLFTAAIKRIGGNKSSLISNISPVFTISIAYLVLGETLNFTQLLGASVIIVTIYYLGKHFTIHKTALETQANKLNNQLDKR